MTINDLNTNENMSKNQSPQPQSTTPKTRQLSNRILSSPFFKQSLANSQVPAKPVATQVNLDPCLNDLFPHHLLWEQQLSPVAPEPQTLNEKSNLSSVPLPVKKPLPKEPVEIFNESSSTLELELNSHCKYILILYMLNLGTMFFQRRIQALKSFLFRR
jgi:hypothetical protein